MPSIDAAPPVPPSPDAGPASPDAPEAAADDVTAHEWFGGLQLGQAGEAVKTSFGPPKIAVQPGTEGATGLYVATWSYPGISLNMVAEKKGGPWTIRLIEITAPAAQGTKAGIQIGSPRAAVEKAYKRSDEGDASKTDEYLVGSIYNGILFHFSKAGVVDKMSMGPFAF